MPPIQRTFSIIPRGPSLSTGTGKQDVRPMTSKQVRKAYKAANKGPSMSRAERRKWEREEQERIRKEFEKEKAAIKAKAARERKREKELAEREERKRNGLPLVTVRPSQDTIARFVRGNGSGKKRDSAGQGVGEKPEHQLSAIQEVMEKEQNEETLPNEESKELDQAFTEPLPTNGSKSAPGTQVLGIETKEGSCKGQHSNEITVHDAESSSKGLLSATPDSLGIDTPGADAPLWDAEPNKVTTMVAPATTTAAQSNHQEQEPLLEVDLISELDDFELDMFAIEIMAQQKQPGQHTDMLDATHDSKSSHKPSSIKKDLGIDKVNLLETSRIEPPPAKPPDKEHSMAPPPPPLPAPPPSRRFQSLSADQQSQLPPLSTQAIFSNAEDFFPTASQLEQELEEDMEQISRKSTPLPESHLDHLDTPFQVQDDKEILREKAGMAPQPPNADELKETSAASRLTSRPNQPKQLLHLAEKKLAAIRQANTPPKLHPKTQNPTRKLPPKPMTKHLQSPKDTRKIPAVSFPSMSRERPLPPTTNTPTSHSTLEKKTPAVAAVSTTGKENVRPPAEAIEESKCVPALSQESYGGDWVDEAALELMM